MKEGIHLRVDHPQLTIGQLVSLANSQEVTRTTHLGNLSPRQLALYTALPAYRIAVDTIHGRDRNARPYELHVGGVRHRLASDSQANDRVVGAVPVDAARLDRIYEVVLELQELGSGHGTLASLHARSLELLQTPGEGAVLLTQALATSGQLGRMLMESLAELGQVRRTVATDGKIKPINPESADIGALGLYGQCDATEETSGLLPPLQGMMAFELLRAVERDRDTAFQIAGHQTREYTRNPAIMQPVEAAVELTLRKLGISPPGDLTYSVIDTTGFSDALTQMQVNEGSQYDLIAAAAPDSRFIALGEGVLDQPAYSL